MNERDYYEIRVEYLRRSESYEAFCAMINDGIWHKNYLEIYGKYDRKNFYDIPLKNYDFFGNIFSPTWDFEEWLNSSGPAHNHLLLTEFDDWPKMAYPDAILNMEIVCVGDIDKIIKDVRDRIIRHMEGPGKDAQIRYKENNLLPPEKSRLRLDDLKRYLSIYDQCEVEKRPIKDVVTAKGSFYSTIEYPMKAAGRDLKKAKQIIRNNERCIFPGDYG